MVFVVLDKEKGVGKTTHQTEPETSNIFRSEGYIRYLFGMYMKC